MPLPHPILKTLYKNLWTKKTYTHHTPHVVIWWSITKCKDLLYGYIMNGFIIGQHKLCIKLKRINSFMHIKLLFLNSTSSLLWMQSLDLPIGSLAFKYFMRWTLTRFPVTLVFNSKFTFSKVLNLPQIHSISSINSMCLLFQNKRDCVELCIPQNRRLEWRLA